MFRNIEAKLNFFFVVAKNTWSEYLEYRLNFILWRIRNILRLMVVYFLWWAIFLNQNIVFGYDQSGLLSYIVLSLIVSGIVFSTRTQDIGQEINQGDLSNLLLKPMSVFYYWIGRDIGDKIINLFFSLVEFFLLIVFLKPPLFLQTNLYLLMAVFVSLVFSSLLYFFISLLLSFFGFWTSSIWGPRILFFLIMEFFAGGLFPLDILPPPIYHILGFLPFTYFLFFPLKIYLGQLTLLSIFKGLTISFIWVLLLYLTARKIWFIGLKSYSAYGR